MNAPIQQVKVSISTRTILKIIAILFLVWILYLVRDVVAIFVTALFIAFLTSPIVDFLAQKKIPRTLAAILVYLGLILIVVLAFYFLIPPLSHQLKDLAHSLPNYMNSLSQFFLRIQKVSVDYKLLSPSVDILKTLGDKLANLTSQVITLTAAFFRTLITILVVIVLSFYMTVEKRSLEQILESLLPRNKAKRISKLVADVQKRVGLWLGGQLVLSLIIGLTTFILLKILGVRYALILAFIAGILEVVPYIGPWIAGGLAGLVALVQSPGLAAMTILGFTAIQQLENYFLVPKVVGKFVGLSPVIIILAVLIGAELLGIIGAILAIPVAATIAVFIKDLFEDHKYAI